MCCDDRYCNPTIDIGLAGGLVVFENCDMSIDPTVTASADFTSAQLALQAPQPPFIALAAPAVFPACRVSYLAPSRSLLQSNVQVRMDADVTIGGPNGFLANLSGSADKSEDLMTLSMIHAGGWKPIPGPHGSIFKTPAFSGTFTMGPGTKKSLAGKVRELGSQTKLNCSISWVESISRMFSHDGVSRPTPPLPAPRPNSSFAGW